MTTTHRLLVTSVRSPDDHRLWIFVPEAGSSDELAIQRAKTSLAQAGVDRFGTDGFHWVNAPGETAAAACAYLDNEWCRMRAAQARRKAS